MSEPLRVFTVDTRALDADDLSLGDLIDICEAADVGPDDLGPMLADPTQGVRRLKAIAAMAWVIARKDEPGLTYAQVLAGRIEVQGETEDAQDTADPTEPADYVTPGTVARGY